MRRFLALLLVVPALTATSRAALMTLTVDQFTGEAWLENKSGESIVFDGYEITSKGKHLSPTGWRSFQDWIGAEPAAAIAALGNATWGELSSKNDLLVEGNLPTETTAAPGFKVSIGAPVAQFVPNDLGFRFNDFSKPVAQRTTIGLIELIGINPHPWQNGVNPLDVDNSGGAPVALDALVIINALNSGGARALPVPPAPPDAPPPYLDVNGDDHVSPLDALMVINFLNSQAGARAVPEPSAGLLALGGLAVLLLGGAYYGGLRRRRHLAWAKVSGHAPRPSGRCCEPRA